MLGVLWTITYRKLCINHFPDKCHWSGSMVQFVLGVILLDQKAQKFYILTWFSKFQMFCLLKRLDGHVFMIHIGFHEMTWTLSYPSKHPQKDLLSWWWATYEHLKTIFKIKSWEKMEGVFNFSTYLTNNRITWEMISIACHTSMENI